MASNVTVLCCLLLLFTSTISASIFNHPRNVRQSGFGFDDDNRYATSNTGLGYNNGYQSNNGYSNGNNGYPSNSNTGYNNGYPSNSNSGYNNNGYNNGYQYNDGTVTQKPKQSYLKNGLTGAAIGALGSAAYTWWKNG